MIVVKNDALTPVKTTILDADAQPVEIVVPGRGWRRVPNAEATGELRGLISAGTLRVIAERTE